MAGARAGEVQPGRRVDGEIRHPLAYARNERGWLQEELARRMPNPQDAPLVAFAAAWP
ncbi:hypothetical protein [Streptomyces milbemycinicus]|uniref:Transposase n=1 Tax=Streptomyces milbemycinicus TaxID=476552 RepID=A0ABW8M329_9ACTN